MVFILHLIYKNDKLIKKVITKSGQEKEIIGNRILIIGGIARYCLSKIYLIKIIKRLQDLEYQ